MTYVVAVVLEELVKTLQRPNCDEDYMYNVEAFRVFQSDRSKFDQVGADHFSLYLQQNASVLAHLLLFSCGAFSVWEPLHGIMYVL